MTKLTSLLAAAALAYASALASAHESISQPVSSTKSAAVACPSDKVIEECPQYAGPCSNTECGASGKPCRTGLYCVPYPSFPPGPRYGCTCSYM